MVSASTGRIVPKTCKSWLCSVCNVWLREGARKLIMSGALDHPAGTDLVLATFTEPSTASLDMEAFKKRHQKTIQRLEYHWDIQGYCTAVEFQKRGALHPHIMLHWPSDTLHRLPEHGQEKRTPEQYRTHFKELVPMAQDLGWGKVCDFRVAVARNDLALYVVKNLAGYATKEAYRKFREAGAQRVRPIRSSQSWSEKKLREWQQGEKADAGPWRSIDTLDGGLGRG